MKKTLSIVTIALATIITSGCCGGLNQFLCHPFGPNSICEPVHRAHYDNGFEVGYGSECSSCGLGGCGSCGCGSCGCQESCGCESSGYREEYGSGVTTGCSTCAAHKTPKNGPYLAKRSRLAKVDQQVKQASYTSAKRSAKRDSRVKQASYTYASGCADCVESDPCCDGCGEVSCECCGPRCAGGCDCCEGPFSWLARMLHPERYRGGCGEMYWGDFHSYPPDCQDPCNQCGQWTGESGCCGACGGCGGCCNGGCNPCGRCAGCCGQCGTCCEETCSSCGEGVMEMGTVSPSYIEEEPVMMSRTNRVARPATLQAKKSGTVVTRPSNAARR